MTVLAGLVALERRGYHVLAGHEPVDSLAAGDFLGVAVRPGDGDDRLGGLERDLHTARCHFFSADHRTLRSNLRDDVYSGRVRRSVDDAHERLARGREV